MACTKGSSLTWVQVPKCTSTHSGRWWCLTKWTAHIQWRSRDSSTTTNKHTGRFKTSLILIGVIRSHTTKISKLNQALLGTDATRGAAIWITSPRLWCSSTWMGRTPRIEPAVNRRSKTRPTLKDTTRDLAETLMCRYWISQQLTTLYNRVSNRRTKVEATLIKAAKTEWESLCHESRPVWTKVKATNGNSKRCAQIRKRTTPSQSKMVNTLKKDSILSAGKPPRNSRAWFLLQQTSYMPIMSLQARKRMVQGNLNPWTNKTLRREILTRDLSTGRPMAERHWTAARCQPMRDGQTASSLIKWGCLLLKEDMEMRQLWLDKLSACSRWPWPPCHRISSKTEASWTPQRVCSLRKVWSMRVTTKMRSVHSQSQDSIQLSRVDRAN